MKCLLYYLPCFILFISPAFSQPCNDTLKAGAVELSPCTKTDLELYANTISGATYQWTGPGNFNSTTQNPVRTNLTILQGGYYIVTATAGTCIYHDTIFIQMRNSPIEATVFPGSDVCDGDSVIITAYTTGASGDMYIIDAFNNLYHSGPSVRVKMVKNGVYKAYEVTTDGCVGDTGYYIANNVPPRPVMPTVSLLKPACAGDSLLFDIHSPDTISHYLIEDPYGTMLHYTLNYLRTGNSGLYKIMAVNAIGCISDPALISVSVGKPAIPGVAIYGNAGTGPFGMIHFTSYVSKAGNNPEYRWMKNGTSIPGATGHTYTATSGVDILPGDEITLQVKADIQPCPGTGTSNTLTISENLSVNDKAKTSGFEVYPNPCNGIFTVVNAGKQEHYTISLVNSMGQQVYYDSGSGSRHTFNAASLPAGMYTLKLQTAGGSFYSKLVISH